MRNAFRIATIVGGVALVFAFSLSATCEAQRRRVSQDQYDTALGQALDGIIAKAGPLSGHVPVAVNLFYAHEAVIEAMPLDILEKAVDAFAAAGVSRVDINPGLYPWKENDQSVIAKYDAIVSYIRQKGMKLGINPQYSPVRDKVSSVDEWQDDMMPIYAELASRYHPDIFVVVHEPTTMNARMHAKASPERWAQFASAAAAVVKGKSPGTRIGAGGLYNEAAYFRAFLDLDAIDVMTLDIYKLAELPAYSRLIREAKAKGKPVYIEETWRPPYFTPRLGMTADQAAAKSVGDERFQDLDAKWMRAMRDWAGAEGLESVTFFWMQVFFNYANADAGALDPSYNKATAAAIAAGRRTKTYDVLKELASGR
jgi:hypothetical protein